MKIVLGLGNPGARYEGTRHNVGFRVVETLAQRHGGGSFRKDTGTDLVLVAGVSIGGKDLLLAKPRTYMNRSGRAALALMGRCGANSGELVVVHDDADLELGRMRLRSGGGAGGHNGIRSLLAVLGPAPFVRVKLGVRGTGREGSDLADYVLEEFDPEERELVASLLSLGADAVEAIVETGIEPAMNRFNARAAAASGTD